MKRILITGATGNIGREVIHYLSEQTLKSEIIVGARNVERAESQFSKQPKLSFTRFDFEESDSFPKAFADIDTLFLLRPPHISQVEKYFRPLLIAAKANGISKIVFLSVQGADKSKVIPHNKVERLIKALGFKYIFIRPSYFMQNLTTTLLDEIQQSHSITLPSGDAKFNWVDVRNIGEAAAVLIHRFEQYENKALDITGGENSSFAEVVAMMSEITQVDFRYKSMNPILFFFHKRKQGLTSGYALVMTLLHFLPRVQKEPEISENYQLLTGKTPTTIEAFIQREKSEFTRSYISTKR